MVDEQKLARWIGPSSDTEQEKQERTERMLREAIASHRPFDDCGLTIYAKGSYANNTNVKADSDVDVAIQCTDVVYWEEESAGNHNRGSAYEGTWSPARLRSEVLAALEARFTTDVDSSGSVAIRVNSSSARVEADVVPCFSYKYYFDSGSVREGTKIFPKSGSGFSNYPAQQLKYGRQKNIDTNHAYKKVVRILKRTANEMERDGSHREVPSYLVESLVFNCRNKLFAEDTWTSRVRNVLVAIHSGTEGAEPTSSSERWVEANDCLYLFHSGQKWTRQASREFAAAAWSYWGYDE